MLDLDKSTWTRVKFGDVVKNANAKSTDPSSDGIDRVIAMEHLDPGDLAVRRWGSLDTGTTFTRRARPGQTLFGKRRAYQRKVAYAEFDAICSGDILTFEAITDKLLPGLLPFIVQSDPFFEKAVGTSAGSLSPRTNWRDLAKFEFDLPPLDQQKCLADLLWSVERHMSQVRNLANCVEVARSTFGQSTLQDIHVNFGSVPLSKIVALPITDGVREKGPDFPNGTPYIRVVDMTRHSLSAETMRRMDPKISTRNRSSEMRQGEIVIALRSDIGLCHVIPEPLDGCNIAQGVGRLSPDRERVDTNYLFEAIMTPSTRAKLRSISKGTTIKEVGLQALRGFEIPLPPSLDMQRSVAAQFKRFAISKDSLLAENEHLSKIRESFLSSIFGGA